MNIRATPSLSAFRSATMIPYELSGLLVIWSRFQEHRSDKPTEIIAGENMHFRASGPKPYTFESKSQFRRRRRTGFVL